MESNMKFHVRGKVVDNGVPRGSRLYASLAAFNLPPSADAVLQRVRRPVAPPTLLTKDFRVGDPVLWIASDHVIGALFGAVVDVVGRKVSAFYGDGEERSFDVDRNPDDPRVLDSMSSLGGLQAVFNLRDIGVDYRVGDGVITDVFSARTPGVIVERLDESFGEAYRVRLDAGSETNNPASQIVMHSDGFGIRQVQSNHNAR